MTWLLLLALWAGLTAGAQKPASSGTTAAEAAQAAAEAARQEGSPEAPALYRKALALSPRWEEGWWALGTLEYTHDHYPECRDAFRQLVRLSPKGGPALTMLGLCEMGTHQDEEALTHLRAGQDLGAGSPAIDQVAKYELARLYTQRGLFEPALGVMGQLAQSAGEKQAYFTLAGIAALWMKTSPEKVPEADRELIFFAGRAFWCAAQRNAAAAAAAMQNLITRYPSSPGVHYFFGSYELSSDADRAVEEFAAELKINPSHPGALAALAAEYLRRGDPAKGLPYARQLVTILPDAVASHTLLGRLLAAQGDLKGGVQELEKAREIDPDHPQPHISLASLYAKLGRKEDAARERREFLRVKDREGRAP